MPRKTLHVFPRIDLLARLPSDVKVFVDQIARRGAVGQQLGKLVEVAFQRLGAISGEPILQVDLGQLNQRQPAQGQGRFGKKISDLRRRDTRTPSRNEGLDVLSERLPGGVGLIEAERLLVEGGQRLSFSTARLLYGATNKVYARVGPPASRGEVWRRRRRRHHLTPKRWKARDEIGRTTRFTRLRGLAESGNSAAVTRAGRTLWGGVRCRGRVLRLSSEVNP